MKKDKSMNCIDRNKIESIDISIDALNKKYVDFHSCFPHFCCILISRESERREKRDEIRKKYGEYIEDVVHHQGSRVNVPLPTLGGTRI